MNEWGFNSINRFARATPWLHGAITAYANYGIILFVTLLVAGWWIARRRGDTRMLAAVLIAGASTLLAVAVNQPIVAAVHEARPYTTHPGILVLATRSSDFSFPSDHATMAGAVVAGLWLASRRLGVIAAAAAVIMAFSRVYIAAHYPQDVIAGLALGAAIALVTYRLLHTVVIRAITAARDTRLRALVTARTPRTARPAPRPIRPDGPRGVAT
jgi:undecaprenyl-diphosphatase